MKCIICHRDFKNYNALNAHKGLAHGKREWVLNFIPWNKNKKLKPRSKKIKDKISKAMTNNPKNKGVASTKEREIERKIKISKTSIKNGIAGGLRKGSGRSIKSWYNSPIAGKVFLQSTYELRYAKWLDENKINWIQNKKYFEYEFENKIRKYYPDFYLIDEDCYVEIKGFKTIKDEAKWMKFPEKLKILFKEDLDKLK